MKQEAYLTTSEFARICGTTKDTLIHYDRIGILKPEKVGSNGYRYYAVFQFFQFGLIATLREADLSLPQIKAYMESRDPSRFLAMLSENRRRLREERERLQRLETQLSCTEEMTRTALSAAIGKPSFEELPAEYFLTIPLTSTGEAEQDLSQIGRLYAYCGCRPFSFNGLVGSIIDQAHIEANRFDQPDHYFVGLAGRQEDPYLHTKPAGTYAVLCHQGAYGGLPDSYRTLMEAIRCENRRIIGPSYEKELLNYLAVSSKSQYIIRIEIPVSSPQ